MYIYSILKSTMPISLDQMDPHPQPDDIGLPQPERPGHGQGSMGRPPRRGILVSVRRLKHQGVNLSPDERKRTQAVVGELKIRQVSERRSEYRSIAEVLDFDGSEPAASIFPEEAPGTTEPRNPLGR